MDEKELAEFEKLAELRHYGQLLKSLLEAVVDEYGLFIDDDVRTVYRWLLERIVFLEYAMDEDFKAEREVDLGKLVELAMPEEIDDIDSGSNDFGYSANDFLQSVRTECEKMESIQPRLAALLVLDQDAAGTTKDAVAAIQRAGLRRERYISTLRSGIETNLFSTSVSHTADAVTFDFLESEALRDILCDRVRGAVTAYEAGLYMDATVRCLSVIEALLAAGLERSSDDAKIDYAMRHPKGPRPSLPFTSGARRTLSPQAKGWACFRHMTSTSTATR